MRIIKYCFIVILFLQIGIQPIEIFAQNTSNAQDQTPLQKGQPSSGTYKVDTGTRMFSVKTMTDLIKLCEEIGWFLVLNFIVGVLVLCQGWFVLNREKKDDQKIPVDQLKFMSLDDIAKMFANVKDDEMTSKENEQEESGKVPLLKKIFGKRKKASAFLLLYRLHKIFDFKKSASDFGSETSSFIQNLKDQFNTFATRMFYLSDTAGALGLLGTVWGMFMVFFKGTMVMDDILHGMGVALATTIVGLIISIILNTFTTLISNKFDRHLDFISKMSVVFHERMIREEENYLAAAAAPVVIDSTMLSERTKIKVREKERIEYVEEQAIPPASEKTKKKFGSPAEIKVIAGNNQSGEVNTQLSEPIIVEIVDEKGKALEGITVVFATEEGGGTFPNHSRTQKILTNEEGRAQTQFLFGKAAGEKTIQISVEASDCRPVTLLMIAKPAPPTKFVELSGNYQTGQLGRRLPEPFGVAVKDKYDNPISRHEVSFHLRKGTGRFQDGQNSQLTTHTNEAGLVEAYFIMDNNRGAREIVAEAKKVETTKIEFEVFAV